MRAFASFALLALAASVSANPFSGILPIHEYPVEKVSNILTTRDAIVSDSGRLTQASAAVSKALTEFGSPEWQQRVQTRIDDVQKMGQDLASLNKQLTSLEASITLAEQNRDQAKRDLEQAEGLKDALWTQKHDNDGTYTKDLAMLEDAQQKMQEAERVSARVTELVKQCPQADSAKLQAAMDAMKAEIAEQSEALMTAKKDLISLEEQTQTAKNKQETYSSAQSVADAANKNLRTKRVVAGKQPAMLEIHEATSSRIRLRAANKQRALATMPHVEEAKQSVEELHESIKQRAEEIRAGLEKLSALKFGPDDVQEIPAETKRDLESMKKKVGAKQHDLDAINASTQKTKAKIEAVTSASAKTVKQLRNLVETQDKDIALARTRSLEAKGTMAKFEEATSELDGEMQQCTEQAAEIAVQMATIECIKSSTAEILNKEFEDVQAKTAAKKSELQEADAKAAEMEKHFTVKHDESSVDEASPPRK